MNRLAYEWNPIENRIEVCGVSSTAFCELDEFGDYKPLKDMKRTCVHCHAELDNDFFGFSPTIFDARVSFVDFYKSYLEARYYSCYTCSARELDASYQHLYGMSSDEVNDLIEEAIFRLFGRETL